MPSSKEDPFSFFFFFMNSVNNEIRFHCEVIDAEIKVREK